MPDVLGIQDAQEGMEVAVDIMSSGAVLVHRGTILTSGLIETLKRRGIDAVSITTELEREADNSPTEKTRVLVRDARAGMSSRATENLRKTVMRLDAQFAGMEEDEVMGPLKLAAAKFWADRVRMLDKRTSELEGEG